MSTPDFAALAAPFPPEVVSWRVGSTNQAKTKAMALAYLDARDVMQRLDAVCGPGGWERRHPHVEKTTTCEIAIWIEGRGWVVKSDGAGDTQVEAEKGSLSDSFKRAAVNWGIGRYLYDLDSPWVEIEPMGRSFRIKDEEKGKLLAVLKRPPARAAEPKVNLAVVAAQTAITMANTRADLATWKKANEVMFGELTEDENTAIVRSFNERWNALASAKEAA